MFPCTVSTGGILNPYQKAKAPLMITAIKGGTMIELFIELTDQIFWEGYAEQLAGENPAIFQQELNGFMNSYNIDNQQPSR